MFQNFRSQIIKLCEALNLKKTSIFITDSWMDSYLGDCFVNCILEALSITSSRKETSFQTLLRLGELKIIKA